MSNTQVSPTAVDVEHLQLSHGPIYIWEVCQLLYALPTERHALPCQRLVLGGGQLPAPPTLAEPATRHDVDAVQRLVLPVCLFSADLPMGGCLRGLEWLTDIG